MDPRKRRLLYEARQRRTNAPVPQDIAQQMESEQTSGLGAGLRGFAKGLVPGGAIEEVAGALAVPASYLSTALTGVDPSFTEPLEQAKATMADMEEQRRIDERHNPYITTGANIAGGVAGGVLGGVAAGGAKAATSAAGPLTRKAANVYTELMAPGARKAFELATRATDKGGLITKGLGYAAAGAAGGASAGAMQALGGTGDISERVAAIPEASREGAKWGAVLAPAIAGGAALAGRARGAAPPAQTGPLLDDVMGTSPQQQVGLPLETPTPGNAPVPFSSSNITDRVMGLGDRIRRGAADAGSWVSGVLSRGNARQRMGAKVIQHGVDKLQHDIGATVEGLQPGSFTPQPEAIPPPLKLQWDPVARRQKPGSRFIDEGPLPMTPQEVEAAGFRTPESILGLPTEQVPTWKTKMAATGGVVGDAPAPSARGHRPVEAAGVAPSWVQEPTVRQPPSPLPFEAYRPAPPSRPRAPAPVDLPPVPPRSRAPAPVDLPSQPMEATVSQRPAQPSASGPAPRPLPASSMPPGRQQTARAMQTGEEIRLQRGVVDAMKTREPVDLAKAMDPSTPLDDLMVLAANPNASVQLAVINHPQMTSPAGRFALSQMSRSANDPGVRDAAIRKLTQLTEDFVAAERATGGVQMNDGRGALVQPSDVGTSPQRPSARSQQPSGSGTSPQRPSAMSRQRGESSPPQVMRGESSDILNLSGEMPAPTRPPEESFGVFRSATPSEAVRASPRRTSSEPQKASPIEGNEDVFRSAEPGETLEILRARNRRMAKRQAKAKERRRQELEDYFQRSSKEVEQFALMNEMDNPRYATSPNTPTPGSMTSEDLGSTISRSAEVTPLATPAAQGRRVTQVMSPEELFGPSNSGSDTGPIPLPPPPPPPSGGPHTPGQTPPRPPIERGQVSFPKGPPRGKRGTRILEAPKEETPPPALPPASEKAPSGAQRPAPDINELAIIARESADGRAPGGLSEDFLQAMRKDYAGVTEDTALGELDELAGLVKDPDLMMRALRTKTTQPRGPVTPRQAAVEGAFFRDKQGANNARAAGVVIDPVTGQPVPSNAPHSPGGAGALFWEGVDARGFKVPLQHIDTSVAYPPDIQEMINASRLPGVETVGDLMRVTGLKLPTVQAMLARMRYGGRRGAPAGEGALKKTTKLTPETEIVKARVAKRNAKKKKDNPDKED